jgi:hypothetical protein
VTEIDVAIDVAIDDRTTFGSESPTTPAEPTLNWRRWRLDR